ncbi:MAG: biotin/lipoyl-containing protein [Myxococcota bacterium]
MKVPPLVARLEVREDGTQALRAPTVGLWREGPGAAALVTPGAALGRMEVLGALHALVAPPGAAGLVVERGDGGRARAPVDYESVLLVLDPDAAGNVAADVAAGPSGTSAEGLVFRAPLAGRFYARPSPDAPAFVSAGMEIGAGATVCLLEVMKTFHRVSFGGPGLPERARVKAVLVADGDDLDEGAPLLALEPLDA